MFIVPNVLNLFRSVGAIFVQRFCLTYRTYGAKETIIPDIYQNGFEPNSNQ